MGLTVTARREEPLDRDQLSRVGFLSVTKYRLGAMASVTKSRHVIVADHEHHGAFEHVFGPDDLIEFRLGLVLPKLPCQFVHHLAQMVKPSLGAHTARISDECSLGNDVIARHTTVSVNQFDRDGHVHIHARSGGASYMPGWETRTNRSVDCLMKS